MHGWAKLPVWLFPQAAVRARRSSSILLSWSSSSHMARTPLLWSSAGDSRLVAGLEQPALLPWQGDMAQQAWREPGSISEHFVCRVMVVGMKVLESN